MRPAAAVRDLAATGLIVKTGPDNAFYRTVEE